MKLPVWSLTVQTVGFQVLSALVRVSNGERGRDERERERERGMTEKRIKEKRRRERGVENACLFFLMLAKARP